MSNNDVPFTAQVAILDQYIHSRNPEADPEVAELILDSVKKNEDICRYFFSNRPDPAWVPILWRHDFFTKQPEFEVNAEGSFLAFWYAHEFLLSIAPDVPQFFIRHLENLETCHEWYKAGAVESLRKLDPSLVSTVVPKILGWLKDSNPNWSLTHNASELMVFMANNNYKDEAFWLFSALTKPIIEINNNKSTMFDLNEASLNDRSPIKNYRPGNEFLAALEHLDALRLIQVLEENLRIAIDEEAEITGRDGPKISYWRVAIEDTEQDNGDSAKDLLLRALRDILDHVIAQSIDVAQPIINKYINDTYEIFRRLALYFLNRYPSFFQTLVVKELMDFSNLDERGIHHEFFNLLSEGFPVLSKEQQLLLVDAIVQGPPRDELERFVEAVTQNEQRDPDEFRNSYIDHWVKNRLWMLREHLPVDTKKILENLISTSGKPDHPDFTSWMSSGGLVEITDTSPLEEDVLKDMTPSEIYEYLRSWKPDAQLQHWPERVTWEGLAGSVANIVVANPESYVSHLELIASYRSVLSQSIFGHLSNDNYPIHERSWLTWLKLIENLIKNQAILNDQQDLGWADACRSMVRLVRRGLQQKDSTMPIELMPKIRDILLVLLGHSDPNSKQDKPENGVFGHQDPLTMSLNHVRPMALEALIIYAIKNAQIFGKKAGSSRLEASVRDALNHKLDKRNDPSWAVHSVFGRYFPSLYWLDKKWTTRSINQIFPEETTEESIWYFVSAWESFLLDGYRSYLMPLLRGKYLRGIEYLSRGYQTKSHIDVVQRFAIHAVLDYCLGKYPLDSDEGQNSLLVKLIHQTNPKIRAFVANACYLVYKDNSKDADMFWPRIKAVWEWRNKESVTQNNSSEYDEEIRNFGKILHVVPVNENIVTLWPLMEGLLPYIARDNRLNWMFIEKFLIREAHGNPARAILYYKMMYDQITRRPQWIHHSDEAKELIYKTINSGDLDARHTTLNLLDNLLRWGDNTFKDLYFTHAK
jgi:hypothetical protein